MLYETNVKKYFILNIYYKNLIQRILIKMLLIIMCNEISKSYLSIKYNLLLQIDKLYNINKNMCVNNKIIRIKIYCLD